MTGRILIIPTPIGNLDDASPRMTAAMRECDLLLCEDTRHTGKLLSLLGVDAKLESYHEHNENAKLASIVERVEGGLVVGIISDAGMPVLSDPGFPLIRAAREKAIAVTPVAGPSAILTALAASGLPPTPFTFYGFPPPRKGERHEFYRKIALSGTTAVVFESPHRIEDSLEDALSALGDVEMTLARELTKLHEEIINGLVSDVLATMRDRENIRGEITLVFAGVEPDSRVLPATDVLRNELTALRETGMRRNDAVKAMAEKHGISRNELYRLLTGD